MRLSLYPSFNLSATWNGEPRCPKFPLFFPFPYYSALLLWETQSRPVPIAGRLTFNVANPNPPSSQPDGRARRDTETTA